MERRLSSILPLLLILACNRGPSPAEARDVLRAAYPALDTTTVVERVWADGPPWFSCAEVIAKFRSNADSGLVRIPLGNWRALLLADWIKLRDTTAGRVVDPGWCAAALLQEPARLARGWQPVTGDTLVTGTSRRGWDVTAGRKLLVVASPPKRVGKDSVMVDYVVTVLPNANGVALRSDEDSTPFRALLRRDEGRWRVLNARVSADRGPQRPK